MTPEWGQGLTAGIAAEIKRHREARREQRVGGEPREWSAQWLSDRTAELGARVTRSRITDLETGRRSRIDLGELLVIAYALQVPPMLLIFPIGRVEDVEVLPDHRAHPWLAARWFAGLAPLLGGPSLQADDPSGAGYLGPDDPGGGPLADAGNGVMARMLENDGDQPWLAGAAPAQLYQRHADAVWDWRFAKMTAARLVLEDDDEQVARRAESVTRAVAVSVLQEVRGEMRRLGLVLPPLPYPPLEAAVVESDDTSPAGDPT